MDIDILNKNIHDLTFEDIEDFCSKGISEGIQLDYKEQLPPKGFKKHFAAFSNTRGGLIIIGVEEDANTGKPMKWEGVANTLKLEDRIYQWITCVSPIPLYDVATTPVKNGKVFILVRIFEGDMTPYYPLNDVNIWVRTGSISNPIDLASPDAAELLFGKKAKAEKSRNIYLQRSSEVFEGLLKNAETERQRIYSSDATIRLQNKCFDKRYDNELLWFSVSIQPFYSRESILLTSELKELCSNSLCIGKCSDYSFPNINNDMLPIPEGIVFYRWNTKNGWFDSQQLFATGLLTQHFNFLLNQDGTTTRSVSLASIGRLIYCLMKSANLLYKHIGHQGGIVGELKLWNSYNAKLESIQDSPYPFAEPSPTRLLLNEYNWNFDLDTSILFDKNNLNEYFKKLFCRIHWDLGYGNVSDGLIDNYIVQKSFLEM